MSLTSAATELLPLNEIVKPEDEAGVAAVLREARQTRTPVYTVGGGTRLGCGLRPVRPGIGLSTAGLNRIVDHAAADLTVTVEAGVTLAELRHRLAKQNQWLPIDVTRPRQATVGGVLATACCGPRRYAYGTIRDYVLGVRAVDGTGEVIRAGGKVVKNVAGYNLTRLLVGSHGTLGVITEATLMVRPLPESSALVVCDVDDFDTAECLLVGLARSRTLPVAIELLAGPERAGSPLPPRASNMVARLVIGFDGCRPEVAWMVEQICEEWEDAGGRAFHRIEGAEVDTVWQWLGECIGDVQIHMLPSALVGVVEEIHGRVPDASLQAHAGNGIVRVRWGATRGVQEESSQCGCAAASANGAAHGDELAALVRQRLRPLAVAAGGNLAIQCCAGDARLTADDVWGPADASLAVMQSIRAQFDPEGILNPGRFVFGPK